MDPKWLGSENYFLKFYFRNFVSKFCFAKIRLVMVEFSKQNSVSHDLNLVKIWIENAISLGSGPR